MKIQLSDKQILSCLPYGILRLSLIQPPVVPMHVPTQALQRFQYFLQPPQMQHMRDEGPTEHTKLQKGQTFSHMLLHDEISPCAISGKDHSHKHAIKDMGNLKTMIKTML